MNARERMITAYLKTADLPEVEKAKLELFLRLLDAVEQEPAAEEPLAAPQVDEAADKKTLPAEAEDPLVEAVKRRMKQENLTKGEVIERLGLSTVKTMENFLEGKVVRASSKDLIESWMQPWLLAEEIVK